MSDRDLRTRRDQVFGSVPKGTDCRICGRNVDDGRMVYCSDYCKNIASGVMSLLNWTPVRRQILERDEKTCQRCGFDATWEDRATDHIRDLIQSKLPDRPEFPSALELEEGEEVDWDSHFERMDEWNEKRDELRDRYGNPYDRDRRHVEVDHITPISEGGHPFDPGNLQTLCSDCHREKTARENSERANRRTPCRGDLSESLFSYVEDGGGSV